MSDRGHKDLVPFGDRWGNRTADGRELPSNIEAEQALLGALLVRNDGIAEIRDLGLKSDHFFEPAHAQIFDVIGKLVDGGKLASPLTLKSYFEHEQMLSEVGGAKYLQALAGSAVVVSNSKDYAGAIIDCATRRDLIMVCREVSDRALDPQVDDPPEAQLETLSVRLDTLRGAMPTGGFINYRDMLMRAAERSEGLANGTQSTGIKTGIRKLNEAIGGWRPGKLYVIGGRTGMGKSLISWSFLAAASVDQQPAQRVGSAFFSLEMDGDDIGQREFARLMGLDVDIIADGRATSGQLAAMFDIAAKNDPIPLWFDDSAGLTARRVRDRIRAMKRRHPGLRKVVVDFLQLLRGETRGRENRAGELEDTCYMLRDLAKEEELSITLLSQLRRLGKGEDPRPTLDQLRESGGIEQAADVVMLLYRRHYYEKVAPTESDDARADWERDKNIIEIIIDKQRQGRAQVVRAKCNLATGRFSDEEETPPAAPGLDLDGRWVPDFAP